MTTAEDRDTWERDEEANRRQATEAHATALPATESDAEVTDELSALREENERLREDFRIEVGLHEEMTSRWRAAEAALVRVRALANAFADDGLARYGGNVAWHIEEAIANEKGDFPDAADIRIASQRERAESAESALAVARAQVEAVRALADEWDQEAARLQEAASWLRGYGRQGYNQGVVDTRHNCQHHLRRALLTDTPEDPLVAIIRREAAETGVVREFTTPEPACPDTASEGGE